MNEPIMLGRHVTADSSEWNYDMACAPVGGKLLALTRGRVCVTAVFTLADRTSGHFIAWAPMLKRNKNEERARGLLD